MSAGHRYPFLSDLVRLQRGVENRPYGFHGQNYTEDLTLEEFASYTGRSLATFKRDFAKISTLSPQRWITEHRLEKAKKMLLEDGVSAQEVSYMVGFKNRSHFSQAFKKQYGYAPANYLKLNRENFI